MRMVYNKAVINFVYIGQLEINKSYGFDQYRQAIKLTQADLYYFILR
jgi:hypothetical protein